MLRPLGTFWQMMYRHFPYLALYVCTVLVLQVIQYSVCVYVWVYCELNECSCSAQTGQLLRNVQQNCTYLPSLIPCTVCVIVCVAQYTYVYTSYSVQCFIKLSLCYYVLQDESEEELVSTSLPPPPPCTISWDQYINSPDDEYDPNIHCHFVYA